MAEVWDPAGIPEALIDGPPVGGDLLLQRTLRRVRAERARRPAPGTVGRMSVALEWVTGQLELSARITGVPPGRLCRLVAVTRGGARQPVGDRFLTETDAVVRRRTELAAGRVSAVELVDASGTVLATSTPG